jgi:protein tyrosine phosphatase (PTP) superfamily phosphohydrolase (DUF442 family)
VGESEGQTAVMPPAPGLLVSAVAGLIVGVALTTSLEVCYVVFGDNLHEVVPGQIYRSSQVSGERLEQIVRRLGIRTVVNVRGVCDPIPWYLAEARVTQQLDIAQEDVGFSACRLPSIGEVRRLVEVLDRAEPPLLIHCRCGADRTGLACVIARLLKTNARLAEARGQLSIRYLHFNLAKTRHMDRFFDLYEQWLADKGVAHSAERFREWIADPTTPGEGRAKLELAGEPPRLIPGRPTSVRVRATNLGRTTWQFRRDENVGVHFFAVLYDPDDRLLHKQRAGLFDRDVKPGESIEADVLIPALGRPGDYRLTVDLSEEYNVQFYQVGNPLLDLPLTLPAMLSGKLTRVKQTPVHRDG